jgi:hypothetical protein
MRKSTALIASSALLFVGVSAQASGFLNTPAGGYLVCVDAKTGAVTHPGTSKCKKGQKRLILGAQGPAGATGANGEAGLVGASGLPGKDGNTIWTGQGEPSVLTGVPGDSYIDLKTMMMFAPKLDDGTWPIGVSLVGPRGPQGPGGSGPAGPAGPAGSQGPAGVSAPVASGANCIGTKCTYKIGDTGPSGGTIFFVDYNNIYQDFDYLEAADFDECIDGEDFVYWNSESYEVIHGPTVREAAWRVGRGASNTTSMLTSTDYLNDQFPAYDADFEGAAALANDSTCGGKNDWFLGSVGEMKLLLEASLEVKIDAGTEQTYWTSTSADYEKPGHALAIDLGNRMRQNGDDFFTGMGVGMVSVYEVLKDDPLPVRPIRRF